MILMNSATAFEFVKMAGALYIIYLGIQSLRRSRVDSEELQVINNGSKRNFTSSVREGFLTNVLNPKVAVFYLALLPQFISPADNIIEKSFFTYEHSYLHGGPMARVSFSNSWKNAPAYFR